MKKKEAPLVTLAYTPRPWQRELHLALHTHQFGCVALHRQGGKTEAACMHLIDCAAKAVASAIALPMFAYVAPELRQARTNMWDRLKLKLQPLILAGAIEISESELWVQFKNNGAKIRLFGAADPDALRGMTLDGVVIDEVAQVKPFVWSEVIYPMLMVRKGWALFIGTPKGINLFSERYFAAVKDPEWFARTWTCYETGALSKEAIDRAKSEMSEERFAREMLCDFHAQGDNQLIPLSVAVEASQRSLNPRDPLVTSAPVILGVDPARFGDDRSVIVRRQGQVCFEPLVFTKIDNMDLAARVAFEIHQHAPGGVFIDAGAGSGVIDRLRQLGHDVIEVPFGGRATTSGYLNRRAEMWFKMKKWLMAGGVIPAHEALIRELATPTFWFNENKDQLVLESKDTIRERLGTDGGGSPDIADALCLTFAVELPPTDAQRAKAMAPERRQVRYSPFDPTRNGGRR